MKGAIWLLSSRDTLAPATHATLTSLRALHPSAPLDRRAAAPTTSSAPLHATPQAVLEAITSFPHGSAGETQTVCGLNFPEGPGLRMGVRGNVGSESVDGGTSGGGPRPIANPPSRGHHGPGQFSCCPGGGAAVRPSVLVWRLHHGACEERGWGSARPMAAVGYTWRRLAGEGGVSACVRPRCSPCWPPRQLGFGVTGWHGSGMSMHVDGMSRTCRRGHVFVIIDFTNAFNTLRRDVILEAVERHIPELLPYASGVVHAGTAICSSRGVFAAVTGGGAAGGPARTALLSAWPSTICLTSLQSSIVVGYLDDMSR